MTKNDKNDKKKRNILIIIGTLLLVALLIFLFWFFNRKYDVTFDFNNKEENIVVKVKYKKLIEEKDIKTSKELGENFINWYEVIDVKDNTDVLAQQPFDFKTKITKNTKLKAVYKQEEVKVPEKEPEKEPKKEEKKEYVTIKFDSNGGSKVNNKTIVKGSKLSLPSTSRSGYKFVGWTYKNGNTVKNNTTFKESTT